MSAHTKEPWRILEGSHLSGTGQILDADGLLVWLFNKTPPEEGERARRVVACWNACAGIPTDELALLDHLAESTRIMALIGILKRKLGEMGK